MKKTKIAKLRINEVIILALIAIQIITTIVIIYGDSKDSTFCLVGQHQGTESSCFSVQNSTYSRILGIKVVYIGLGGALTLLATLLLFKARKIEYKYFLMFSLIGALFGTYFIIIQFFALKSICSSCMIVDISAICQRLYAP